MPPSESLYPRDWLAIAEKDLTRVHRNISIDPEAAGFYLQQSAEKFLKAFLLSHGWELRRTHDLLVLLDHAADIDDSLAKYRSVLTDVTDYYMAERYPHLSDEAITEDEVAASLKSVSEMIGYLRQQIG